jgi:SAM-dependent methyltransferase
VTTCDLFGLRSPRVSRESVILRCQSEELKLNNRDSWTPSKYELVSGRLRGSRNECELSAASRVVADLVAEFYSSAVPRYAKGSLLDLGCGKAPLYGTYCRYVGSVTCIDWEESLHGNQYIDFAHDLNTRLPFTNESFDTIIASDVLEHIRDPRRLLAEISRSLKSDGVLLMNVPFLYGLHEMPHDYYRYTRYSLESLTEDAGLHAICISPIGGICEVIGDIVSKALMYTPHVGTVMAALMQNLTNAFRISKLGRRVTERTFEQFPLGYTVIAIKS